MIHLKLEIRSQNKQIPVLGKQLWIIVVLGVMLSLVQPQLFLAAFTAGVLPKYYYLCSAGLLQSFFFFLKYHWCQLWLSFLAFHLTFLPAGKIVLKYSFIWYAKNGKHKEIKHGLALKELLVLVVGKEDASSFQ